MPLGLVKCRRSLKVHRTLLNHVGVISLVDFFVVLWEFPLKWKMKPLALQLLAPVGLVGCMTITDIPDHEKQGRGQYTVG